MTLHQGIVELASTIPSLRASQRPHSSSWTETEVAEMFVGHFAADRAMRSRARHVPVAAYMGSGF